MVDWTKYREQFPPKYWEKGKFETIVPPLLWSTEYNFKKMLDIGGGVTGTECLRSFAKERHVYTYFLDPFVPKPDWIDEQITWDNLPTVDLMVCRGAINYLTPSQLSLLNDHLNGLIVFNTFSVPPSTDWKERAVTNAAGDTGIERFRLVGNVVEHELGIGDTKIYHEFFWYDLESFSKYFSPITRNDYNANSVIMIMGHRV